jgi:hypothetical protein
MRAMQRSLALLAAAAATLGTVHASAQSLDLRAQPFRGRYRFIMTGATLTEAIPGVNGVNCLESGASATVSRSDVPSRARLVSATLYLSGSLFDDGTDFAAGNTAIFDTDGLSWERPSDQPAISTEARAAADREASFLPPGASAPVTVSAAGDQPKITVFFQTPAAPGAEGGNIAFFVTPIDVTNAINDQGRGIIDGTYNVSGVEADVCHGLEARCDLGQSCSDTGFVHTKGTASWALLLVVEDPSLPLASIAVFEGLESMVGSFLERTLVPGGVVSAPGAGSLGIYALEGDADIGNSDSSSPCRGQEYLEFDGDLTPTVDGLCLEDDDNPIGNLFNSTINVQPAAEPAQPGCDPQFGCCGDGLCGVTGVDIDRFDVSDRLTAGADRVRIRLGTASDRVALAVVVLSVGIFEPQLETDTQVRVLSATPDGLVQLGGPLDYSIAVSNFGNIAATNVTVFMDGPQFTDSFEVLSFPSDGVDLSLPSGGDFGNGLARIEGFRVEPGEVAEVRVRWRSTCDALTRTLATSAQVGYAQQASQPFVVQAPGVVVRGPPTAELTECAGADPFGPFAPPPPFFGKGLGGGGGCNAAGGSLPLLLALVALWRRRARALLAAVAAALASCAEPHVDPVPPEAEVRWLTSLDGLPGDTARCGTPLMVEVRRLDQTRFCVDRFEASLDGGVRGDEHQGTDDEDTRTNGSTEALATNGLRVTPTSGITWYQAKAACENAGKRLCTEDEWERACRGPQALEYPYGDAYDDRACNGFFDYAGRADLTGSYKTCGSHWGAYDLSGNLEEWVETSVPRTADSALLEDRVVRGGSFRSNANALRCFGGEFHAPPGDDADDRGFRCCMDL